MPKKNLQDDLTKTLLWMRKLSTEDNFFMIGNNKFCKATNLTPRTFCNYLILLENQGKIKRHPKIFFKKGPSWVSMRNIKILDLSDPMPENLQPFKNKQIKGTVEEYSNKYRYLKDKFKSVSHLSREIGCCRKTAMKIVQYWVKNSVIIPNNNWQELKIPEFID